MNNAAVAILVVIIILIIIFVIFAAANCNKDSSKNKSHHKSHKLHSGSPSTKNVESVRRSVQPQKQVEQEQKRKIQNPQAQSAQVARPAPVLQAQPAPASGPAQQENVEQTIRKPSWPRVRQNPVARQTSPAGNPQSMTVSQNNNTVQWPSQISAPTVQPQSQPIADKKSRQSKNPQQTPVLAGSLEHLFDAKTDVEAEFGITEEQLTAMAMDHKKRLMSQQKESVSRNRGIRRADLELAERNLRESVKNQAIGNKRIDMEEFTQNMMKQNAIRDAASKSSRHRGDAQAVHKTFMSSNSHN